MRRLGILLATCSVVLAGAVWCATEVWDSTNFTMDARKWQAPPEDVEPSLPQVGGHHPTDDCGICHAPGRIAGTKLLTLSATVYDSRAARWPLPGAEVVFQDYEGNYYSMTANDLGIMWTEEPMSGDTTMGDPTDSNTWRYKAWVRAEGGVRPMMTMPAVGGMSVPRMSCNMHHVVSGTLGGLWAMPASTLRSYPEQDLSYQKHIFPILRSKCGPCHVPGEKIAREGKDDADTIDYTAGLDLMTYPGSTYEVEGITYTKLGIQSIVNTSAPDASLLFSKTVYGSTHGGGSFWGSADSDYQALRQWIAEGAQNN